MIKKIIIMMLILITMFGLPNNKKEKSRDEMEKIIKGTMVVNGTIFQIDWIDQEATRQLLALFPMEITMQDMNRNEKYFYLNQSLAANAVDQEKINQGDIMLYGSDCFVIFYESFGTNYRYTKLGHIKNSEQLKEVLGSNHISIRLQLNE